MTSTAFIFTSILVFGLSVTVGCTTGVNGADGTSGASVEGPTSCDGTCEACAPVTCECDDGTMVNTCACSKAKGKVTCSNESYCETARACDDHGGPASTGRSPKDDDDPRDAGSTRKDAGDSDDDPPASTVPSVVEVSGRLDRSTPISQSSGGGTYYLLVTDANPVKYSPDNSRGSKFAQTGFRSFPVVMDAPATGTCKVDVQVGLGLGNATVNVAGTDKAGESACKSFFQKITASGIKVHGTNVKFQSDTIPRLNITLSP